MTDQPSQVGSSSSLSTTAGGALIWGAGFTFIRDVLQFITMLVVVRLVSPEDYGRAAMAQALIGFVSVFAFRTFAAHALQMRDPEKINWQLHFTAAFLINVILFVATNVLAWAMYYSANYAGAVLPLVILSFVFLIEIPATLRHTMVQVDHDWRRFRVLTIIGVVLGSVVSIIVAVSGGGVWALVLPALLFGLPGAIDLLLVVRWRPNFFWSWAEYRDSLRFGFSRMGSAAAESGRNTAEHASITSHYDFGALGVYTRSIGLATLAAGRLGSIILSSLYPVITRAEDQTERFRRIAGLVLRGVAWLTIPAAVFLSLSAEDVVRLIYGKQWLGVIDLAPLAAAYVALHGISHAVNRLLLANEQIRTCLVLDISFAVLGVGLIFWLVPHGVKTYLLGLMVFGLILLIASIISLVHSKGITWKQTVNAMMPAIVAASIASLGIIWLRLVVPQIDYLFIRLLFEWFVFSLLFLLVIRIGFTSLLRELLEVSPGRKYIYKLLYADV